MSFEKPEIKSSERDMSSNEVFESAQTIDDVVEAMKNASQDGRYTLSFSKQTLPVEEVAKMIRGEGGYDQKMINDLRIQNAVNRVLERNS